MNLSSKVALVTGTELAVSEQVSTMVRTRLRSLEQPMAFATAGELLMQKRQSVVAVAIGVFYLTGVY